MPLAIQEHLLPGDTLSSRFQTARDLGFDAIQVHGNDSLAERIPELVHTASDTGLRFSAVDLGHTHLLHPTFDVREAALVRVRRMMGHALDLEADGVIFRANYAPQAVLPDLHPYKSALELEGELLVSQLKNTLCDLAYAMGAHLILTHTDSQDTHLVQRLRHAHAIRRKLKGHPHLHTAADLYAMSREEADTASALGEHLDGLRVLMLRDSSGGLPGSGTLDFGAVAAALRHAGYTGWLTLAAAPNAQPDASAIQHSLDHLRAANLI